MRKKMVRCSMAEETLEKVGHYVQGGIEILLGNAKAKFFATTSPTCSSCGICGKNTKGGGIELE